MAAAGDRTLWTMVPMVALITLWTLKPVSPQDLDLSPSDSLYMLCRRGGRTGICLKDTQCYKNHSIAFGGEVIITDIRGGDTTVLEKCTQGLWCCTDDSNVTVAPSTPEPITPSPKTPEPVTPEGPSSKLPPSPPTPTVENSWYMPCRTGARIGMCLKDTQCYKNHSIAFGGDVIITDIREGDTTVLEKCTKGLWCCTDDSDLSVTVKPSTPQPKTPEPITPSPKTPETVTPEGPPSTKPPSPPTPAVETGSCLRAFDECTWCVGLYRESGDVSRFQRTSSGLYCAGALIGGRVVLTSATCVRTVQKERVRARAPHSANPTKYYDVVKSVLHARYCSSSHANDFGLMLLSEDIDWGNSRNNGACLDLSTSMSGNCQVIGFTKSEQMVLTSVSVVDGRCGRKATTSEWSCGNAPQGECNAAPGSPVLCPITSDEQGGMTIGGVTRMHCIGDSVSLGKLQPHAEWLQNQLNIWRVNSTLYSS